MALVRRRLPSHDIHSMAHHLQRQCGRRRRARSRRFVLCVVTEAGSCIDRQRWQQRVCTQQHRPQLRLQARVPSCGRCILHRRSMSISDQALTPVTCLPASALRVGQPKGNANYLQTGQHQSCCLGAVRCMVAKYYATTVTCKGPHQMFTCSSRSAERCSSVAAAARQLPARTSCRSTSGCSACGACCPPQLQVLHHATSTLHSAPQAVTGTRPDHGSTIKAAIVCAPAGLRHACRP